MPFNFLFDMIALSANPQQALRRGLTAKFEFETCGVRLLRLVTVRHTYFAHVFGAYH